MSREYQVLFFTHTGAIRFERRMNQMNIPCSLMPVPRALSSNCGVSAHIQFDGDYHILIDAHIEKIYINSKGDFEMVYNGE